jgi:hypothetical protein
MVEMVSVTAIACGHEDAINHNDLRHDPLSPQSDGSPTISETQPPQKHERELS